jgi:hypothetical protein
MDEWEEEQEERAAELTGRLRGILADNEARELDAAALTTLQLSGVCMQRITPELAQIQSAGRKEGKAEDRKMMGGKAEEGVFNGGGVRIRNCNPYHLFFGGGHEDVRGWDMDMIGEFMDVPLNELLAFVTGGLLRGTRDVESRRREVREMYSRNGCFTAGGEGGGGFRGRPTGSGLCAVALVWKRELRDRLFCHDLERGVWWYAPMSERGALSATGHIRCYAETERVWRYRYLTPQGEILREGDSPYGHGGHDYEVALYPLVHGRLYNFVDDLIDLQKIINRMVVQIDTRLNAGLKGLKVYDARSFPGVSPEAMAEILSSPNGLLPAHPVPGKDLRDSILQMDAEVRMTNDFQMLQTQLNLINEVSGVNGAMQGKLPSAGTTAALYAHETVNAGLNTLGLMEAFEAFRVRRGRKVLCTPVTEGTRKGCSTTMEGTRNGCSTTMEGMEVVYLAEERGDIGGSAGNNLRTEEKGKAEKRVFDAGRSLR